MKKYLSTFTAFALGIVLATGMFYATQTVQADVTFNLFDAGEQTDGDIDAKIRQQIDNGHTTITLYNARKEVIENEDVYKARIVAVTASY